MDIRCLPNTLKKNKSSPSALCVKVKCLRNGAFSKSRGAYFDNGLLRDITQWMNIREKFRVSIWLLKRPIFLGMKINQFWKVCSKTH